MINVAEGITDIVNIIIVISSLSILIFLIPNLKVLLHTFLNIFNFKSNYIKGEFLTLTFAVSLIWAIIYFLYNNFIISQTLYNQLFEFWWAPFSILMILMISMVVRSFNNLPLVNESNKPVKFKLTSIYWSLIIVLLASFFYLVTFIYGVFFYDDGYWYSSLPIFYSLIILNIILLVWLFTKIFKSNKEESINKNL